MSTIRYRRNIDCLSANQLHDFREALAAMFDLPPGNEHSYATIAGLHGMPAPSYCAHGAPGFLTWHRAYMEVYEKTLRCINSSISLPFWDWSSGPSTGLPAACSNSTYVNRAGDTVPNPLYAGPLPGGGMTSRSPTVDTRVFNSMATSAQNALTSTTFSSFQSALNGPHGSVHVAIGGQMGSVSFAGYDPIFYLHHCNVDRVWAQWQKTHSGPLPASEAAFELEPFTKPYSTDWKTGADFATTDQLGYRYTNFCFVIVAPDFWKIIKIKLDPRWFKAPSKSARLVMKSTRMPRRSAEVLVFVNEPNPCAATAALDNPRFAGSVGLFGMTASDDEPAMAMRQRPNERFDLELDISKALVNQHRRAPDDELAIKLVPVGNDGKPVSPDATHIDDVELLID